MSGQRDRGERGRAGALIRTYRLAAGLSQRQLADSAMISIGVIRDLEQHRTTHLQPRSIDSLVRALGLDQWQAGTLARAARAGAAAGWPQERQAWDTGVRVDILGSLAVWRGIQLDPGPPGQRAVLGVLALTPGLLVRREAIIDAIWGENIPATAVNLVQKYVSRLRALLDPARLPRDPGALLVSTSTGYRLQASAAQLDVLAFERLVTAARAASSEGDQQATCGMYERALGLWRGEPLADLDILRDHPAVAGLSHRRAEVIAEFARAACAAGMYDRVLGHLRALVAREPLNENAHALLMTVLAGSGQQADALAVFEALRIRLDEQLGVRPGPRLSSVHLQVLRQDVPGGQDVPGRAVPMSRRGWSVIPRQLSAPSRLFTGRAAELSRLTAALDEHERSPGQAAIWAISGAGSVGKTSLALHWSHRNLDRFPDGQLWVNLRGFGPSGVPMASELAVRGFLAALGADPAASAVGLEGHVGLYRSLVAGKRMLVVLDNARDSDQVIPLLPGSPGCMVLVTSRRQLAGLVIGHGARLLHLDVLPEGDARDLLARHIGAGRMDAEPDAVAELLSCCAGLPLAISSVAARAAAHPGFPLAALAADLRDAATRLDALETGDQNASVRAVLSWSYQVLDPETATVFGLMGLAPGPDISLSAAASLTMLPTARLRLVLRDLESSSLVQQHVPGRYRMHALLRLAAADQVSRDQPAGARTAALRRVTDFYLHTAVAGLRWLSAGGPPIDLGEPAAGCVPSPVADQAAAVAWFDAEHACLLAALDLAVTEGWPSRAWQLARAMSSFRDLHVPVVHHEVPVPGALRLGV